MSLDVLPRSAQPGVTQQLFGLAAALRRKPAGPDQRVDVPEVTESTRVSFGSGASAQAGFPLRQGVDAYRDMARRTEDA